MSDQLTDEAIRSAFAELQATEQARFVSPGVDAAHRTVRRRRVTASTTASLAAVVLLGAVYLSANLPGTGEPDPHLRIDPDPDVATSQEADPSADGPLSTIGGDPELNRIVLDAVGEAPPGTFRVIGENTGGVAGAAVAQGAYLLRASCGGDGGGVVVTGQVGDDQHLVTAQCATTAGGVAAGVGETAIVVAGPGELHVTVEPETGGRTVAVALIPQD